MADEEKSPEEQHEQLREVPEPVAEPEESGSKALADALKISFLFLKIVIVVMVVGYLLAGFSSVGPSELHFKLRFGELVPTKGRLVLTPGSGLYFKWPWERIVTVSTDERTLELEEDFWAQPPRGEGLMTIASLDFRENGYLLTGDVNIVHLKLRARYRTRTDPQGAIAYAFGVEKPEGVLRRALMAATCKVVGTMKVAEVLEREALFSSIQQELRARLERFEEQTGSAIGVMVTAVEAIQVEKRKNPSEPGAVREAFFEAQNAYSVKDQLEQEGKTEKVKILNSAHARAAEILAEAQGYRERQVRSAEADAESLERLLPIYNHSPEVRRILVDRYYQRAVEEVAGQSPGFFVLHKEQDGSSRELRLMLNRPPEGMSPEEVEKQQFSRVLTPGQ